MADRLTLTQLLQVMKNPFEHHYDCSILFHDPPVDRGLGYSCIATLRFKYVGLIEMDVELYADGSYRVEDDLHRYREDLRTLAYVVKNANELLHLLKHCNSL